MAEITELLIIEDDTLLRTNLSEQLTDQGYGVSSVESGERALSIMKEKKFDIAILDLKLPKIDGFEVLKYITSQFPNTKVIVLTAYADLRKAEKCKHLGASDVIAKPYDLGDLFDAIQRLSPK
ncbi:MAG TPA: response regulator [Bacteroidota bacterium]|nr:response regulator [Bacteroidota bacterium]